MSFSGLDYDFPRTDALTRDLGWWVNTRCLSHNMVTPEVSACCPQGYGFKRILSQPDKTPSCSRSFIMAPHLMVFVQPVQQCSICMTSANLPRMADATPDNSELSQPRKGGLARVSRHSPKRTDWSHTPKNTNTRKQQYHYNARIWSTRYPEGGQAWRHSDGRVARGKGERRHQRPVPSGRGTKGYCPVDHGSHSTKSS